MAFFRRKPPVASIERAKYESTEFESGLWRIWDDGRSIGWLSTSDGPTGWVEIEIQLAAFDWWLQHCERKLVALGSEFLEDLAAGRLLTDRLGTPRYLTITWVSDKEFDQIASEYYGFY